MFKSNLHGLSSVREGVSEQKIEVSRKKDIMKERKSRNIEYLIWKVSWTFGSALCSLWVWLPGKRGCDNTVAVVGARQSSRYVRLPVDLPVPLDRCGTKGYIVIVHYIHPSAVYSRDTHVYSTTWFAL